MEPVETMDYVKYYIKGKSILPALRRVYSKAVTKEQFIWQANKRNVSNRRKRNALSQAKRPVEFEDQAMEEPTFADMEWVCGTPAAEGKLIRFVSQKNVSDRTESEQWKWSTLWRSLHA
jgi:hypothetical protein